MFPCMEHKYLPCNDQIEETQTDEWDQNTQVRII
jgi:hypothetical protein